MNIYLIERMGDVDWDQFDSAVVYAENEAAARFIHPSGKKWDGSIGCFDTWVTPPQVKVTLVGFCVGRTTPGVICASFNAG